MIRNSGLKVRYDGHLQIIEFKNTKKKNAWSLLTYEDFISALDEAVKNDNVKMTVLTGHGNYYSSGNLFSPQNDKNGQTSTLEDALMKTKELIDILIDFPKVLVAVVNGPAIGVACTTLALCDAVYAVDTAWFHTPFSNWGITAEGCSTYLFPRILGPAKANKLLLFAEKMTAVEAYKCNFITGIYKPSESEILWSTLRCYTSLPLQSWMGSKKLMRQDLRSKLHEINEREVELLKERFYSDDFSNALMKFMSRSKSKI